MRKPHLASDTSDAGKLDLKAIRSGGRLSQWIKTAWLAFWMGLATLLVFPPIMLVSLFSRTGNRMFQLSRLWAWIICKVTNVKIRTHGLDKIDHRRSYVIIANHQSHFDGPALALGLGGIQFRWIAKQELLKIPLFGHCLRASRNIFIDRSNRERAVASIQEGLKELPAGVSVMCFAEGTRSPDGRIGPFKKGGFAAAIHNGMPVLPVLINGSRRVLPRGSLVFKPGTIELTIDSPIETQSMASDYLEELIFQTRELILSHFKPAAP